jgi:hypothetical protein
MLLILKGSWARVPPTRVFLQKSVYWIDCKGLDFFGGDEERARV